MSKSVSGIGTRQLLRSAPYFPVAEVEQSAQHYERVFGFHRDLVGGAPPEFAILSRDGLAIMLRRIPAPDAIRPNEKQGGTWDVLFFWVLDAEALYAELKATGPTSCMAGRPRDSGMTSLNELVDALRATTGCLGVEAARTLTGENVIFAWVEDKAAVLRWYSGTVHQAGIKTVTHRMPSASRSAEWPTILGHC